MKEFSLRDVCNKLLVGLKSSLGEQNVVKLDIDMGLPDQYEGEGAIITEPIKSLASFVANYLVNGIISIGFSDQGQVGQQVSIQAEITGSGIADPKTSAPYKSPEQIQSEFQAIAQILPNEINFNADGNKISLGFVLSLKSVPDDDQTELQFKTKKVLLAEDNAVNVIVFSNFMDDWGTGYSVASNGQEALDLLRVNSYDAVLMDIQMPVMDGIEAIRELRKFNKDIPVIVLSAASYQNDIDRAMEAGANEFLKKPVSSWELYSALAKFF